VRRALGYVRQKCGVDRPLIDQSFQTDGCFLFIQELESLINASKGEQMAMPDLLPQLNRIERDQRGLPLKLYKPLFEAIVFAVLSLGFEVQALSPAARHRRRR
jgi:hypothetical protein